MPRGNRGGENGNKHLHRDFRILVCRPTDVKNVKPTFIIVMTYKENQIQIQQVFFNHPNLLGGMFKGKTRPFALQKYSDNFVNTISCQDVVDYFKNNGISWWGGNNPTNHILSSQIACINHLFPLRDDPEAVLSIVKKIDSDIDGVEVLNNDKWKPEYISFEVVSDNDHLNETKNPTRGSQCTSIDAVILATKKGKRIMLIIEWKYVETYGNTDKSKDTDGKASGTTRLKKYSKLIYNSQQLCLKKLDYSGSVYFHEPFYQLMRQTLWAEEMIKNRQQETIQADDFLHVLVVPKGNDKLRGSYKCSNCDLESTWRRLVKDQAKFKLFSPDDLFVNLSGSKWNDLKKELENRYWQ